MHEKFSSRFYKLNADNTRKHLQEVLEVFYPYRGADVRALYRAVKFVIGLPDIWLTFIRVRFMGNLYENFIKLFRLEFTFSNELFSTLPSETVFLRVELRYTPSEMKTMVVGDVDLKALIEDKYATCGYTLTLLGIVAEFLKTLYVLRTSQTTTLGSSNSLVILKFRSVNYRYKVWVNFDALESLSRSLEANM
jgi:hypothetical protein